MPTRSASSSPRPRQRGRGRAGTATPWPGACHVVEDPEEHVPTCPCPRVSARGRVCTGLPSRGLLPRSCQGPAAGHRRRWPNPLRALQLAQSTPGLAGRGSPPSANGTRWSAASSPGRTGSGSRCQPGQCQPWVAAQSSTVRFANRRHADVRRTGWSGVRRKRFAKPGRPQRSQRRSWKRGPARHVRPEVRIIVAEAELALPGGGVCV